MKDDSIDNRVLVSKDENNNKSDTFPYDCPNWKAGFNRIQFYEFLHKNKLMSAEKLKRLTRKTPLTDDELAEFVNRQIVSTSQSVKAVTDLLKIYKPKAKIVYSKGNWVSEFRHRFDLVKSRDANNYHHAHDAYLNIIVGRVYNYYYTEHGLRYSKWREQHPEWTFNPLKVFDDNKHSNRQNLVDEETKVVLWDYRNSIKNIKKQLYERYDVLVTRRTFVGTELFSEESKMNKKAAAKSPNPYSLKNGLKVEKYGGYKLSYPFFALVESDGTKKLKRYTIESMPSIWNNEKLNFNSIKDSKTAINYLEEKRGLINPKILFSLKKKTILMIGKTKIGIASRDNNITNMFIDLRDVNFTYEEMKLIKRLEKAHDFLTNYKSKDNASYDDYIHVSPARTEKNQEIIIEKQEEIELFEILNKKLQLDIYANDNGVQSLLNDYIEKINIFELNLCQIVNLNYSILTYLKGASNGCDLSAIGKGTVCKRRINNNIKRNCKIVYESITGFYSKVVWEYKE